MGEVVREGEQSASEGRLSRKKGWRSDESHGGWDSMSASVVLCKECFFILGNLGGLIGISWIRVTSVSLGSASTSLHMFSEHSDKCDKCKRIH